MTNQEGRLINIRKLVALDVTIHGSKFILVEYGLAVPVIIFFGLWLILSGIIIVLGFYVLLTGVNYVPLLSYAIVILRKASAQSEVKFGLAHDKHYVRKYSLQQLLIFVPLLVLLIAVVQEVRNCESRKLQDKRKESA